VVPPSGSADHRAGVYVFLGGRMQSERVLREKREIREKK
jgi:hypothetical protein